MSITRILSSDKILMINDFPLLGQVQNFDWAPAFNAVDIFELGRTTKVATAMELETSGTFEVLSVGGTAGILARMIEDINPSTGAFLGYKYTGTEITSTATGGTTTTITDTVQTWTVNQFSGLAVSITAGTNAGLTRQIVSNTATILTVSPPFPVAIDATSVYDIATNKNNYTWTQDDLRNCNFDIVEHEKTDGVTFNRSVVLPRSYVTTISGRADSNGTANETFNFSGEFVVGLSSPFHDVRSVPGTKTSGTTVTLADTAIASTTHTLAYLYLDERRIRTTNTDAIYATLGAAGVITVTGYTVPDTARIQAVVYKTTPGSTFPVLLGTDRATSAFFVRGYMVDLFLAPVDYLNPTQNEKWLRVQTCDWSINLRTEQLRQLAVNTAGTSRYAIVPTYPFEITANATVIETDWTDWKAILDPTVKTFIGTDVYNNSYDFSPASLKTAFALIVQYRTLSNTLLQTWSFTDMRPEGYGTRTAVGGHSEITWSLRGTAFTLQGFSA